MVKYCLILIVSFINLPFTLMGQVNCKKIYSIYDSTSLETLHPSPGYDEAPYPINGYKEFYIMIVKNIDDNGLTGKVFVQFVIDSEGQVFCERVVKSTNELLNTKAFELIKKAEFIPAELRGKKVASTIILPITFGSELLNKKAE